MQYGQQGDVAVAYARIAADAAERDRYRRFLEFTLDASPGMTSGSRANLFFTLGQIDLMAGNRHAAELAFRRAFDLSESRTKQRARADAEAAAFLGEIGVLPR